MYKYYTYRSKPEYIRHLKELTSNGFNFPNKNELNSYVDYYDDYADFMLAVDYTKKELLYGSVRDIDEEECEIIKYYKKSNISIY